MLITLIYGQHKTNKTNLISGISGYICTVGWSDFSFSWNFEKKQVVVVTFGKKNMFSSNIFLIKEILPYKSPTRT